MAKQCYKLIDNINTKLLQLEQTNLELKQMRYGLNKILGYLELILYLKNDFQGFICKVSI
jgi:hypothetical protein